VFFLARGEEGDILAVGADLVVFDVEGEGNEETNSIESSKKTLSPSKFPLPKSDLKSDNKVLAAPAVRKAAMDRGLRLSKNAQRLAAI